MVGVSIGTGFEPNDPLMATCPLAPWEGDEHCNDNSPCPFSGSHDWNLMLDRRDNLYPGSTCWNLAMADVSAVTGQSLIDSAGNWTMSPVYPYGNRTDYPALEASFTNIGTSNVMVGDNQTCITSTTLRLSE
jgi:hypothetical protein